MSRLKFAVAAAALAAGGLLQVAPVAATQAPGPVAINFQNDTYNVASVAAGNDIVVDVIAMNTGSSPTRAWQFGVTYDPAVVTLTAVGSGAAGSVNYSDEFLRAVSGASVTGIPGSIDNTAGTLSTSGDSLLGGSGGATGTGRLATLHFRAVANGSAPITFTSNSRQVGSAGNLTTGLGTTVINVGPVAQPDLVVQNGTTVSTTTPAGDTFNVTFTVANTGTLSAGASTASVAVTNATPASRTAAVGTLAAGANSGTLTVGPFTLASGQTLANVTITADSAGVVTESNESNNTAATAYSFAAYNSNGQTPIDAQLAGTLVLTAPPAVTTFPLTAGTTNVYSTAADRLNVRSNLSSWQVTISGDNTGHLHEWDPATSAYVTGAQLITPLDVHEDSHPNVRLSGVPQLFVNGVRATSDPAVGNNYNIAYEQFVGFNDAPVNPPHTYHIVITWAASGTF